LGRVEPAPEVFEDFDRFLDQMMRFDVEDTRGMIRGIV
jgi:hypothetical protein